MGSWVKNNACKEMNMMRFDEHDHGLCQNHVILTSNHFENFWNRFGISENHKIDTIGSLVTNIWDSYNHKNNIGNEFLGLKLVRKDVLLRLVSPLVQKLIFNTAAGGHFEFLALQNSAQIFLTGMVAYFVINTLKYPNQSSNFTSQRLVTEPKFLTLLDGQLLH